MIYLMRKIYREAMRIKNDLSSNLMKQVLSDKAKFKIIKRDPNLTSFKTVQNHSDNLR